MARADMFPAYLYQRQVQPGEAVSSGYSSEERQGEVEDDDGASEYESSSSDEEDDEDGS